MGTGMGYVFRYFYTIAGWNCLGLGFIGIFLPIVPTTPFVLLAAFCFSRGSNNLHRWLLEQKTFGPLIRDWQQYGVIRRRGKLAATAMIVLVMGYTIFFATSLLLLKVFLTVTAVGVMGFIWSRPSSC